MWMSIWKYLLDLGTWGLLFAVGLILDGVGIYQFANPTTSPLIGIPPWVWLVVGVILTISVPVVPYHKMRLRLEMFVLENLLNEVGNKLKPKVRAVAQLANTGARLGACGRVTLLYGPVPPRDPCLHHRGGCDCCACPSNGIR